MTDQEVQERRASPRWARRARELGEDIAFVVDGWSGVPKPPPRVVLCIAGCAWTWSEGPPEVIERVLQLLGN